MVDFRGHGFLHGNDYHFCERHPETDIMIRHEVGPVGLPLFMPGNLETINHILVRPVQCTAVFGNNF